MTSSHDFINTDALKYSESFSDKMEQICEPLFTNFEITNFGYARVYDNGKMLRLSTDHEWTKKYFINCFYNDINFYSMQKVPEGGVRKVLVYGQPIGEHYSALYDHNIWNIVIIYERQKKYGNIWFFGATREKSQVIDFYLNNMNILERFILYFKEKTSDIVFNPKNESLISIGIDPFLTPFSYEKNIKEFLEQVNFDKFYLEGEYKGIYFSKKEFECILHLSNGKSVKEIANIINISPKTVESYINNMKKKVNGLSTSKLINIFEQKYNFYI